MPSFYLSRFLCLVCLLMALPEVDAVAGDNSESLLRDMRQAYGGDHWSHVGALAMQGRQTSEGLSGTFDATINLRDGHYVTHWQNEAFATDDGLDAQGRWHRGASGMVGPYDSDEAKAVAASESWLQRFGFLQPATATLFHTLPDIEENGYRFQRLEATPPGGRAVTLWVNAKTHLLDRAVWGSSFLLMTQRYQDYHLVGGLEIPFQIGTSATLAKGGTDGSRVETVEHVQLMDSVLAGAIERPASIVRDVDMANSATQATTSMHLEGGFLLVEARINGKGPFPFILDTGGHAILTVDAAKRLGLSTRGNGVSSGAGPGTMSTAYAEVKHLALGDADVRDLTFLVMPYPFGFSERGKDREPIAGILGLEIFQRFAATLDYDHHLLTLEPFDLGTAPPAREGNEVTLRFTDDMPLVEAKLDDRAGLFGVDTGNSGALLAFPQWAERVGLIEHYKSGLPLMGGGVGGLTTSYLSHARSLELGGAHIAPLEAVLTRADSGSTGNPSEAGNIGEDVLARFNVHFDYRREQMVLMPRANPATWPYAMGGIRVEKPEDQRDRYLVTAVMPHSPAEQAGLKAGDAITAVDGRSSLTLGLGEVRDLINHRPEDTPLVLTLADGRVLSMTLRDFVPH